MEGFNTKDLIITLLINGFHLRDFNRVSEHFNILEIYKYDNFGAEIKYAVLVCNKKPSVSITGILRKTMDRHNSKAFVLFEDELNLDFDSYTFEGFYKKIGGVINTGLVLNPKLPSIMGKLGLNILPDGLEGEPDDLLEIYSKESLQFLFRSPARRYGKDRSFESLPDGVLLANNSDAFLLDSKAYSKGFEFTSDDINRFEKYVKDFNKKYGHLFSVKSFVVISGKFQDSKAALLNRSTELISRVQVPISCIQSTVLADMVAIILNKPNYQSSIDWNRIFVNPLVKLSSLTSQIKKLEKDNIIN